MSSRIDKLVTDCFRGSSVVLEIEFDKAKPFTLIFGENGTGKSTIADGIDFVANQCFGSLDDRRFGVPRSPFVTTVGKLSKDCRVEITSGQDKWVGQLVKQKVSITGPSERIRAMVLRRAQLLKLVEAEPAKRYEALQRFIDVSRVEAAEQQLRDAHRTSQNTLNQAVAVLAESRTALDALWTKEGSPDTNSLLWAKSKSESDTTAVQASHDELKGWVRAADALRLAREALTLATNNETTCAHALETVKAKIAALPSASGEQTADLVSLLDATQSFIAEPNAPTNCPVCEQPVVAADLRASITTRLESLQEVTQLVKQRTKAQNELDAARLAAQRSRASFMKSLRETTKALQSFPVAVNRLQPDAFASYADFLGTSSADLSAKDADALFKLNDDAYDRLKTRADDLQADLNKHNAIVGHYERSSTNTQKAVELEALIQRLKEALDICEDTRKDFAQTVLNEVADEASKLYEVIHPSEPLGSLKLLMNANKRASIDQEARFEGRFDVPPQAYFSESHLDTLGFCVWVAVAKRSHAKETVIVLDDVFTSVDSVHLTRIMHLLTTIVDDFAQLIVLTHYRTWRDRYRLNQGPAMKVQLLELHRWSLQRGVRLSGTMIGVEELEKTLATEPLSRQAVASQAGILLEAVLDRLSIQYRRKLPRNRDNEWTLGDLLSGCKKLLNALSLERVTTSPSSATSGTASPAVMNALKPFLDETGALIFIRNQVGCHFNLVGSEVADVDVRAFGTATVNLVKALSCDDCGDIPDKRDGTHFRCGCKQTKMSPLEYD
jgi:hypothetical protein